MSISKNMHSAFTDFFERPSSETLRPLLKLSVGETNNVDYKEQWPEKGKLAKHVLALANSGGGILVIGVKEGDVLQSIGLEKAKDKTDIIKQLSVYIPGNLSYEIFDFNFGSSENSELKGKIFQVMLVESNPAHLPYMALKGAEDLKNNSVYVRKGCSSTEAGYTDLQGLFDARISTQQAAKRLLDLGEHCEQLKLLFSQRTSRHDIGSYWWGSLLPHSSIIGAAAISKKSAMLGIKKGLGELLAEPKLETYDDFINECILKKKRRIRSELDISE
ncbi:ATP-binding protein [Bacillus subtilis]|nr:ATP-binding protein [Pseudomonas sp. A29(2023)]MDL5596891.1 ATP-binding protein [Bacillus subtilis]